ncbi:hypothetical protein ACRAWG_20175 [Methylobacterium sp. P31]
MTETAPTGQPWSQGSRANLRRNCTDDPRSASQDLDIYAKVGVAAQVVNSYLNAMPFESNPDAVTWHDARQADDILVLEGQDGEPDRIYRYGHYMGNDENYRPHLLDYETAREWCQRRGMIYNECPTPGLAVIVPITDQQRFEAKMFWSGR